MVIAAALGTGLLGACGADPQQAAEGSTSGASPEGQSSAPGTAGSTSPTAPTPTAPTSPSAGGSGTSASAAGTTSEPTSRPAAGSAPTKTSGKSATADDGTDTTTSTTTKARTTTKPPEPVDATLAEIPVGGAVVKSIKGRQVVLSQPSPGTVRAFDARCTHQGCPVSPAGGELRCPCHGSVFALGNGSVKQGPATAALGRIATRVHDGGVSIG